MRCDVPDVPDYPMQVYFVPDPLNPGWKVFRDVEQRSGRVDLGSSEETLSAPGRRDATVNINHATTGEGEDLERGAEPVLEVDDVAQVLAHVEHDDEAAHLEMDHEEALDEDDVGVALNETETEIPARGPRIWDLI